MVRNGAGTLPRQAQVKITQSAIVGVGPARYPSPPHSPNLRVSWPMNLKPHFHFNFSSIWTHVQVQQRQTRPIGAKHRAAAHGTHGTAHTARPTTARHTPHGTARGQRCGSEYMHASRRIIMIAEVMMITFTFMTLDGFFGVPGEGLGHKRLADPLYGRRQLRRTRGVAVEGG